MPAKKPPMPPLRRRAFHEAGHAIVAVQYGIIVYEARLLRQSGRYLFSKFQSLSDYCLLQSGKPIDLGRLSQYIVFLMAGSVAEVIAVQQYHQIPQRSVRQSRFRAHCFDTLWSNPDVHLDLAFCYLFAWFPVRYPFDIYRQRRDLWKQALQLLEDPALWAGVNRVAGRLAAGDVLDQSGLLATIESTC